MGAKIPSQAEYEANEARNAERHIEQVERAPLADRKDGAANYFRAMADDPAIVAERISWLIDGNYGFGEMMMAKRIVANPRLNRSAALGALIAIFEWHCPRKMANDAWKKLSQAQKATLDAAINVVITAAENEEE
jgi:hypothetical protein